MGDFRMKRAFNKGVRPKIAKKVSNFEDHAENSRRDSKISRWKIRDDKISRRKIRDVKISRCISRGKKTRDFWISLKNLEISISH